jgi:hypothetical protein
MTSKPKPAAPRGSLLCRPGTARSAPRAPGRLPAAVARALLAATLVACLLSCGGGFFHDNENAAVFDETLFGPDTSDSQH